MVRGIVGITWEYACTAMCKGPVRAAAAIRWSVRRRIVHSGARKIAIGARLQTPRWPGRAARQHKSRRGYSSENPRELMEKKLSSKHPLRLASRWRAGQIRARSGAVRGGRSGPSSPRDSSRRWWAARELAADFPQPSSHRRIAHKEFFDCRIPGFTGLRCLLRLARIDVVSALRARLPGCIPGTSKAERLHLPKPRNQRRKLP